LAANAGVYEAALRVENEMGNEHIREDSWVVQSVTGASAYLRGVDYSQEKFRGELEAMVEYIKA